MTEEKLLNAKMEHYSFDPLNYKVEDELMVTITLCEYRELVKGSARYDALLSESYKRRNAAEDVAAQLRERVRSLQEKLRGLQERIEKECGEDVRDVPSESVSPALP